MTPDEESNTPLTSTSVHRQPHSAIHQHSPKTAASSHVERPQDTTASWMNNDVAETVASDGDFSTTTAHETLRMSTMSARTSTGFGVPKDKPLVTWKDALVLVVCLIAFVIALAAVFDASFAIRLGQAKQLIVIGFLLSIMGFCLSTEAIPTLIAYEASSSNTILQNLEGISRLQLAGPHIQLGQRTLIFLVLALPVALSVAYKAFQGGFSQGPIYKSTSSFGTVGPPGTLGIGWGLSLFINATLPWYSDPGFDRTYGFNTYVQSENVTALLDGPLPAQVSQIQSQLTFDESMNITANVLAVVASLDPSLDDSAENLGSRWGSGLNATYKPWASTDWVWYYGSHLGLMTISPTNVSKWWVSRWSSVSANCTECFASRIKQYSIFQQRYNGVWTITPGSVALVSASPIPNTVVNHPNIIENQDTTILEIYHTTYTEFDYHFLDNAYGKPPDQTKIKNGIKTDATLLGSMVWSRLAALDGPFTNYGDFHNQTHYEADAALQKSRTTLQRSAGLVVVLALNPVLVIAAIVLRVAFFYRSPVTDGFGMVSMLAAACDSNGEILRGAALSGTLEKAVSVRFVTNDEYDLDDVNAHKSSPSLKVVFGEKGKSVRLRKKVKYR